MHDIPKEKLLEAAIEGALYSHALDNLGIYPKSVSGGPHEYVERTEYQKGWNDAILKQTKLVCQYYDIIRRLEPQIKEALHYLLISDEIILSIRDDKMHFLINVNDIFFYAADAEEVEEKDLTILADIHNKYGYSGIVAWVSTKRKMKPLQNKIGLFKNYSEAIDYLKNQAQRPS